MKTKVEKSATKRVGWNGKFHIDCFPFIFSNEELEVLEKKGHIMKALSEGMRSPSSNEERSFVKCIKGNSEAISTMEKAWLKYLNRRKLEASLLQTEEVYQEYKDRFRA